MIPYNLRKMGRIILVTGGGRRAAENTLKSLTYAESYPRSPFWLDLLSPSERLLGRISNAFRLDPEAVRVCLSRHRQPSCEDFGDYLFIQTSLLEPSRKTLFIQRDVKILLSREYLITVHKSQTLRVKEQKVVAACRSLKSQASWENGDVVDAFLDALLMDSEKHQRFLLAVEKSIENMMMNRPH